MGTQLRRWVGACTAAEALGMTAAASAAKVSQSLVGEPSGAGELVVALSVVVAAGLVEGVALGTAQSWALRHTHPHGRRRFVAVTVVLAGLAWAGVSAPAALAGPSSGGAEPAQALVVAGGAGLGLVMGALLGAAQGWALRSHVERPGLWVAASAIAWVPAMAVVFAGATTPGADWSGPRVALLGCLTGAVAGAVLGAVLARCVPWLGQSTSRP